MFELFAAEKLLRVGQRGKFSSWSLRKVVNLVTENESVGHREKLVRAGHREKKCFELFTEKKVFELVAGRKCRAIVGHYPARKMGVLRCTHAQKSKVD